MAARPGTESSTGSSPISKFSAIPVSYSSTARTSSSDRTDCNFPGNVTDRLAVSLNPLASTWPAPTADVSKWVAAAAKHAVALVASSWARTHYPTKRRRRRSGKGRYPICAHRVTPIPDEGNRYEKSQQTVKNGQPTPTAKRLRSGNTHPRSTTWVNNKLPDHVDTMNCNIHSDSAPAPVPASIAIARFIGRSVVAGLLAAATLSTGAYLFWLIRIGSIGEIELGWISNVALTSLLIATIALLMTVRFYSVGRPNFGLAFLAFAVSCFAIAVSCFIPFVLLVLRDSWGVLTLG